MTMSAPATRPRPGSGRPVITRIAAGIDGFPEGRDAAALGQLLAEATGADLMLVAVHSPGLLPAPPELGYKSQRTQSQLMLREVRSSLAPGKDGYRPGPFGGPRAPPRCQPPPPRSPDRWREPTGRGRTRANRQAHPPVAVPVRVRARGRASRNARRSRSRLAPDRCRLRRDPRVRIRAGARWIDCRRHWRRSPCAGGRRRQSSHVCPLRSGRGN